MTGTLILDTVLFFVFLLTAMYVALVEAAITAASRQKLDELLSEGDERASLPLELKSRIEHILATSRIVMVFFIAATAVLFFPHLLELRDWFLSQYSGDSFWLAKILEITAYLVYVLIVTLVYLIAVLLISRPLGKNFGERIAMALAGSFTVVETVVAPIRSTSLFIASLFLKPFGIKPHYGDVMITEENVMEMLERGAETGVFEQTEHDLIESIFQFTDTDAKDIMIPRTDIVAIDYAMSEDQLLNRVVDEGFTRLPVYRESIDDIVGVVYAKDIVSLLQHQNLIIFDDIIRPAFFVYERKPISELLRDFQRRRIHLAIVVDEFGGTQGLITMEDILEEIVGEIQDEYDEEEEGIETRTDGSYIVQAKLHIGDVNEELDLHIPESEDYDTVGGFVTSLFGRIPDQGDEIEYNGVSIEILEVDDKRISLVLITKQQLGGGNGTDDFPT